jgi:glutamyl-tRNA synthetase
MGHVTRIAPSPTGDMHIGTARTAYFNWLLARASGGRFLLRIDDTDPKRSDPAYTQVVLDVMAYLGLDYDQLVYQSQRFDFYRSWLIRVPNRLKDGAVLLDLTGSSDLPSSWTDEIAGPVPITANDIAGTDGLVLLRSDGTPTYHWASVVDDINLGITFVLRGSDHISNTAKQVILFNWLDRPLPKFAHVGLIAHQGKPLSKRDGAASMLHYRNAGYDPDAVLNFLARLGWGPKVDDRSTTMLPRDRMLQLFLAGGNLRSSQANLDLAKLEALDRKYKAAKGVWRNRARLS